MSNHSKPNVGTSLAVQWLRVCTSKAGGTGSSPDGVVRSHMPQSVAKTNKTKELNADKFHNIIYQRVKVIKYKGRLSNCHRQEETKETQKLNVMWGPGLDSGTERGC